jgi:hypothetical protein
MAQERRVRREVHEQTVDDTTAVTRPEVVEEEVIETETETTRPVVRPGVTNVNVNSSDVDRRGNVNINTPDGTQVNINP